MVRHEALPTSGLPVNLMVRHKDFPASGVPVNLTTRHKVVQVSRRRCQCRVRCKTLAPSPLPGFRHPALPPPPQRVFGDNSQTNRMKTLGLACFVSLIHASSPLTCNRVQRLSAKTPRGSTAPGVLEPS